MTDDDRLSLGMLWAGALMVFTPIVAAAGVLGVWWRQRTKAPGEHAGPPHAGAADGRTQRAPP